jgi:hypothetical protein
VFVGYSSADSMPTVNSSAVQRGSGWTPLDVPGHCYLLLSDPEVFKLSSKSRAVSVFCGRKTSSPTHLDGKRRSGLVPPERPLLRNLSDPHGNYRPVHRRSEIEVDVAILG